MASVCYFRGVALVWLGVSSDASISKPSILFLRICTVIERVLFYQQHHNPNGSNLEHDLQHSSGGTPRPYASQPGTRPNDDREGSVRSC